jgi:hypothetical protein
MKQILFISAIFISSTLWGWTGLNTFEVHNQSGKVVVEWTASSEQQVDIYIVQRSMNEGERYFDISEINPRGAGYSYLYIDNQILGMKGELVYTYRLKVRLKDGSVWYSQAQDLVMNVSNVQMTWGSIKAMFQ